MEQLIKTDLLIIRWPIS